MYNVQCFTLFLWKTVIWVYELHNLSCNLGNHSEKDFNTFLKHLSCGQEDSQIFIISQISSRLSVWFPLNLFYVS